MDRNGQGPRDVRRDDGGPRPDPLDPLAPLDPFDSLGRGQPAAPREVSVLEMALARIAGERREAAGLLDELLANPVAERRHRVRDDHRYQTLGLCELVVQRGLEEGFGVPRRALDMAELGIEVACHLDPAYYGEAIINDLLARAWAYLGNARRVNSDLTGAEQALTRAEALLHLGSGDPLEEARVLDFQASLLSDRGHEEEALACQERVVEICRELNEPHRIGRALIKQGLMLGHLDRFDEAVEMTEQALTLIEPGWEPRLQLMARHNLIGFLGLSGRGAEALERLEHLRCEYAAFPDAWTLLRFDWLRAILLADGGRREEGAALLERVRQGFLENDRPLDAAWADLYLTLLLLELGRPAEAAATAQAAYTVFMACGAVRPTLAAALLRARARSGLPEEPGEPGAG
jgi:tetratricopeptide (TPR) repeat protein